MSCFGRHELLSFFSESLPSSRWPFVFDGFPTARRVYVNSPGSLEATFFSDYLCARCAGFLRLVAHIVVPLPLLSHLLDNCYRLQSIRILVLWFGPLVAGD